MHMRPTYTRVLVPQHNWITTFAHKISHLWPSWLRGMKKGTGIHHVLFISAHVKRLQCMSMRCTPVWSTLWVVTNETDQFQFPHYDTQESNLTELMPLHGAVHHMIELSTFFSKILSGVSNNLMIQTCPEVAPGKKLMSTRAEMCYMT